MYNEVALANGYWGSYVRVENVVQTLRITATGKHGDSAAFEGPALQVPLHHPFTFRSQRHTPTEVQYLNLGSWGRNSSSRTQIRATSQTRTTELRRGGTAQLRYLWKSALTQWVRSTTSRWRCSSDRRQHITVTPLSPDWKQHTQKHDHNQREGMHDHNELKNEKHEETTKYL